MAESWETGMFAAAQLNLGVMSDNSLTGAVPIMFCHCNGRPISSPTSFPDSHQKFATIEKLGPPSCQESTSLFAVTPHPRCVDSAVIQSNLGGGSDGYRRY